MARSDPYFQFPLCLLAMPLHGKDLALQIIDYCLVSIGEKLEGATSMKIIEDREKRLEKYLDEWDNLDLYINLAASRLKYEAQYLDYSSIKVSYQKAKEFIKNYESRYGIDAYVRTRTDIVLMFNDWKFTERKFRILCAIYSAIGNKKYAAVTYAQVQYRSLGYKSKLVFEHENNNEKENTRFFFSKRQVGLTIEQLEIEGWFTSFRPNNRKKYYSIRLSLEELAENLFYRKSKSKELKSKKKELLKKYQ